MTLDEALEEIDSLKAANKRLQERLEKRAPYIGASVLCHACGYSNLVTVERLVNRNERRPQVKA